MAVKLRLMRIGRRGQPFYRIVAVDSRKKRDGAYIEKIGHYNPLRRPADLMVDDQKALKWLGRGAIPSDTVRNLLSRRGIMMALTLQKRGLAEDEIWDKVSRFRLDKEEKLRAVEKAALAIRAEAAAKTETAPPEVEDVETPSAAAEASSEKTEAEVAEVTSPEPPAAAGSPGVEPEKAGEAISEVSEKTIEPEAVDTDQQGQAGEGLTTELSAEPAPSEKDEKAKEKKPAKSRKKSEPSSSEEDAK